MDEATTDAYLEYSAWSQIVEEWKLLGTWQEVNLPDFNSPEVTPLVMAIRLWGERLAAMRVRENGPVRRRALSDAICCYEGVCDADESRQHV